MGVQLEAPQATNVTPRVAGVEEPSAASLMGLQKSDVILSIDQAPTETVDALLRVLRQRLPGEIVQVKVFRGMEEITLTGILGRKPGDQTRYGETVPKMQLMPRLEEWPDWQNLPNFNAQPDWLIWPEFQWDFKFPEFQFDLGDSEGVQREVKIRYPESTLESERETLIQQAKQQNGEDAVVEFIGNAHSVSIRQSSSSTQPPIVSSPIEPQSEDKEL